MFSRKGLRRMRGADRTGDRCHRSPADDRHIVFVVTVADTARSFLTNQMATMISRGFRVTLICEGIDSLDAELRCLGVAGLSVPMARGIRPYHDAISLMRMSRLISRLRPVVIVFGTPKASLVTSVAAAVCGVPVRVHVLHGLRFETVQGFKRRFLLAVERLSSRLASETVCVSESLRQKAIDSRAIVGRSRVVGHGSFGGVDLVRFHPSNCAEARAPLTSCEVGTALTVGFVGRIARDKGVDDLVRAFIGCVAPKLPGSRLLVVGEYDLGDPVRPETRRILETDAAVDRLAYARDIQHVYGQMDMLVLATHREGLGMVALEASACGVPVVVTDATGAADTLLPGSTGYQVPVGDWKALGRAILRLSDADERFRLGQQGRRFVAERFDAERVCANYADFYEDLILEHGRSR